MYLLQTFSSLGKVKDTNCNKGCWPCLTPIEPHASVTFYFLFLHFSTYLSTKYNFLSMEANGNINIINNKCARQTRTVKFTPFPESRMVKMRDWFMEQTRQEVYETVSADE